MQKGISEFDSIKRMKRKLGFLRDIPFAGFELAVIVVGVVLVLASSIGRPLTNSEYVP